MDVTIRQLKAQDAAAVYAYSRRQEVYKPASMLPPTSVAATTANIAREADTDQLYAVVLKSTGTVIGNVSLYWQIGAEGMPDEANRELGYALNPDYWQHGYMTQGVSLVLAHAFTMGVASVNASAYRDNVASVKLLERLGFKRSPTQFDAEAFSYRCEPQDFVAVVG